jgi:L-iditol 2-dehydrogenase
MAKMWAAMYYGKGDIRLEEVPRPVPGPGEVLMHVHYCGICGSDARSYQKGPPPGNFPMPRIMGHEFSGQVAELGAGVHGFRVGDRVAAAPATSCGQCFYCRKGALTLCLNAKDYGTSHNGAQAEYALVLARMVEQGGLVALPDELTDEKAALIEPAGTCYHGMVTRGRLAAGEAVVVVGDGAIGLIQVMLARHLGAGIIVCAGHHDARLAMARRFGAEITVNTHHDDLASIVRRATEGMGADLVMVSVPNVTAFEQALLAVRGDGRLVLFGGVPRGSTTDFDPNVVHYGELAVVGSFNCNVDEFRHVAQIARSLPLEELISHQVPLARIIEGYEALASKDALKVLVDSYDHGLA